MNGVRGIADQRQARLHVMARVAQPQRKRGAGTGGGDFAQSEIEGLAEPAQKFVLPQTQ